MIPTRQLTEIISRRGGEGKKWLLEIVPGWGGAETARPLQWSSCAPSSPLTVWPPRVGGDRGRGRRERKTGKKKESLELYTWAGFERARAGVQSCVWARSSELEGAAGSREVGEGEAQGV